MMTDGGVKKRPAHFAKGVLQVRLHNLALLRNRSRKWSQFTENDGKSRLIGMQRVALYLGNHAAGFQIPSWKRRRSRWKLFRTDNAVFVLTSASITRRMCWSA